MGNVPPIPLDKWRSLFTCPNDHVIPTPPSQFIRFEFLEMFMQSGQSAHFVAMSTKNIESYGGNNMECKKMLLLSVLHYYYFYVLRMTGSKFPLHVKMTFATPLLEQGEHQSVSTRYNRVRANPTGLICIHETCDDLYDAIMSSNEILQQKPGNINIFQVFKTQFL